LKVLSLVFLFTFISSSCNYEEVDEGGLYAGHVSVTDDFTIITPTVKTYLESETIDFTLSHPFALTVTGGPRIPITVGSNSVYANYFSGNGTKSIVFRYTALSGDLDLDGIETGSDIDLNGGSISFLNESTIQPVTLDIPSVALDGVYVDAIAPIISISPASIIPGIYYNHQLMQVAAIFSENVVVTGTPQIVLDVGGTTVNANYVFGSNGSTLIFSYAITGSLSDFDGVDIVSLNLNSGTIKDGPGNTADISFVSTNTPTSFVNGESPYAMSYAMPVNKTYSPGESLIYALTFSEAVLVAGGVPDINIDIGGITKKATYLSGSGTSTLIFQYIVITEDVDADGATLDSTINLNGATIQDAGTTNALVLINPPLTPGVIIDAELPKVTLINPPPNANYIEGQQLYFTLNYSMPVTVTGVPRMAIILNSHNPAPVYADYSSGSGTNNLIFRYVVASGEQDLNGITLQSPIDLNGGVITGSNSINADDIIISQIAAIDTTNIKLDALKPYVTSITAPTNADYATGMDVDFILNFNEIVSVTNSPRLTLTVGLTTLYANYLSGTGTNALTFRYTIANLDQDLDGIVLSPMIDLNTSGTIKDNMPFDATLDFTSVVPDLSNILVNNNVPIQLTVVNQPSNAIYDVNIGPAITVEIRDSSGDIVDSATHIVTMAFGADPSGGTATLGGTLTVAAVAGVATFSNININTLAVGYTLNFTAAGLISATSTAFNIEPGVPTQLIITQEPTDSNSSVSIAPAITVEVRDVANNLVTNATGAITLSFDTDPTGSATISGTTGPLVPTAGIATFSDLNIDKAGAGFKLSFTSAGLTSATSAAFSIISPYIALVTPPANATYVGAQNLDFTVTTSAAVIVTGAPQILIDVGGFAKTADYQPGLSSSTSLVFRYTTINGEKDTNGIVYSSPLSLNGGTILDAVGNALTPLTFTPDNTTGVLVDGVDLVITSITPPTDSTYLYGHDMDFAVNYNDVAVVAGSPRIQMLVGITTVYATYISGSGSNALIFRYTVGGSDDTDGVDTIGTNIDLNSGSITDEFSDNASLSFTAAYYANKKVEGVVPNINSVTPPTNKTYLESQDLDFIVAFSEAVNVTGTRIAIGVGASTKYANYFSGSGSTSITYRYTVTSADLDLDGIILASPLQLNSGTLVDFAGNTATPLAFTIPDTSGVLLDAVSPVIISVDGVDMPASATYLNTNNLDFTVNYSSLINVTGTPRIGIDAAGTIVYANYLSGTGTSALKFRYTVEPGQSDTNGITLQTPIELNGGTLKSDLIVDGLLVDALRNYSPPDTSGILIDSILYNGIDILISSMHNEASKYTVLAGTTTMCTASNINGDMGSWGFITAAVCAVTGVTDFPVTVLPLTELNQSYNALLVEPCDSILAGNLSGATLSPGVHCFSAAAAVTGILTLNGPPDAVWVIKTGAAFSATAFTVNITGGGSPCNIFWGITGAFASTGSSIKGNVISFGAGSIITTNITGNYLGMAAMSLITGSNVTGCPNPAP